MDTEKEHGRQLEYAPILADMHLEILFFFFFRYFNFPSISQDTDKFVI